MSAPVTHTQVSKCGCRWVEVMPGSVRLFTCGTCKTHNHKGEVK